MGKVKIAIIGVGNCANSLIQGLQLYGMQRNTEVPPGLVRPTVGPYGVGDIEVVAAFDVAKSKVGLRLGDAMWAFPNGTYRFDDELPDVDSDIIVQRGPTLDGLGKYLREFGVEESSAEPVNVAAVLKAAGATVLVNYLPVGSQAATERYATAALEAGCAMVNCMPVFLSSNPDWAARFKAFGLPIIGDDVKSQVGATLIHRALAGLFRDRGAILDRTYQINIGGNSDFMNMLERNRLESKKISKTDAVVSIIGNPLAPGDIHIGPSDYVNWLGDKKIAYIRLEGRNFGGAPMSIELRLDVWDSPNSAGIVIDAVRCAQLAKDRGLSGPIEAPSAYFMKAPPKQIEDGAGLKNLETWLNG